MNDLQDNLLVVLCWIVVSVIRKLYFFSIAFIIMRKLMYIPLILNLRHIEWRHFPAFVILPTL